MNIAYSLKLFNFFFNRYSDDDLIEIAEKILTKELADKSAQVALVNDVIDQVKFN